MNLVQMLISFEGRMRRRDFWLSVLILLVAQWILQAVLGALFWPALVFTPDDEPWRWMYWSQWSAGLGVIWLVLLWPRLAIGVKRFHDRDKSGLWLLLCLIPVIGWIWLLIELGFLDGTPGPNKFGPSPKGANADAAATA